MWKQGEALGITLIIAAMGFALWLALHPHSPGWSIGAFGLVAFIASYRMQSSMGERIAWFIVLTALLILEFRAIDANDAGTAATKQAQNEQFQTVIGELKDQLAASQNQYASTITHVNGVLKETQQVQTLATKNLSKVEQAINTETGGDSFCYVTFDPPGPRFGTSSPEVFSWVTLHKVGKYPVYSIRLLISDSEKANYLFYHLPIRPTPEQVPSIGLMTVDVGNVGTDTRTIGGYEVAPSDSHSFQVSIYSFTSFPWTEDFYMQKVNGKWKTAVVVDVSGNHPKSRGFYKIDEGFPLPKNNLPIYSWMPTKYDNKKWLSKMP